MPMSSSFHQRLKPVITDIVHHFGTPFHLYDEVGIRETGNALNQAFSAVAGFREFFAVKALPNPFVLSLLREMGFGFDCSSIPELALCRSIGATGEDIIFSSNNTTTAEFQTAAEDGGCILNVDDMGLIEKIPQMPRLVSFRYNPGLRREGNSIIGNPVEAKYGLAHHQLSTAYDRARKHGAKRFGLHAMLISNERDHTYMVNTTRMLLDLVEQIFIDQGIRFEFINIGGGLGIAYHPDEPPLNLGAMAEAIIDLFQRFKRRNGYCPMLYMESGRYITGPHGVLIVTAINRKETYRTHIGVDACMSALMRPGIYGAYHHISLLTPSDRRTCETVDVVGSLCENNDKFAVQRDLPAIKEGDLLCIHDTGAHGHAMGFNYNGRLRPKELLLRANGDVELIRREETLEDYLSTLKFAPCNFTPQPTYAHASASAQLTEKACGPIPMPGDEPPLIQMVTAEPT